MRVLILMFLFVFMFTSCNGQEVKKSPKQQDGVAHNKEVKPQESWKVNKEVDENGNVTRLDSTYVWSYSSDGKELSQEELDSLMNRFTLHFERQFPKGLDHGVFGNFANDSAFMRPFINNEFFFRNWNGTDEDMEQFMKRADSLQRQFMNRFHDQKQI